MLSKALSGFANEQNKLIFGNADNGDSQALEFSSKDIRRHLARQEERNGQLLLVRFSLLQHALDFDLRWFCRACRHEPGAKDEAACRVHKRDQVEITVCFGSDGRVIHLECNLGLVRLKLVWVKHAMDPCVD